ncbi:MAG: TonB-dependent receptor [Prevotellaceae bacterium]|jgi:TonB-linked SusC/RagA family outer membrane protein|nr:TonB-dependent receptor [Prevotellaceae bacterium]
MMKHYILGTLFACLSLVTFAQQRTVTGTVKDQTGEPIIGAAVTVKDSPSVGTVTNVEGTFTLSVPPQSTLTISYVGYLTQEVNVGSHSSISVVLREDNQLLDEVVVIGYGTQRRGDVTSAVGSVKRDDFMKGAVRDAGQLIQGKIAGLAITNPGGDPVGNTSISLRGVATISGTNTAPLILVDGVPGDFSTVAPEDIESIDVLKDGSAAAIYGSRATNGVVLITTRAAEGDRINNVEYSGYLSTSAISKRLEMLTAADYRRQIAEGIRDAAWDLGATTDWQDEIMRTPLSHVHNIAMRGGNKQTNYIVNLNYRKLQGIMKRSDRESFQGRAQLRHSLFDDKVKLGFAIIGNKTGYTSVSNGGSYNNYIFRQSLIHNPTEPIHNDEGGWNEQPGIFEYANPLGLIYETDGRQDITQLRFNGDITVNPIKELTLKALFSYDKMHRNRGYYETKENISTIRDNRNGYAALGATTNMQKLMELTAQYSKTIDGHTFTALAGYSYQETDYTSESESNYNFPTDSYSYNNIGQGAALKEGLASMGSSRSQTNLIGFFGRLNYNYKDRYLLMAALRHEGASQLVGTDNEWGTFPSVSLGWRITQESFMKNQTLFSDLKLRAGYGVTGSQPNASFRGVPLLGYGLYFLYNGRWIQSLSPTQNPNPNLKWEEKHETNIGLDFGFLDGRISGSIDYYNREIRGLLYNYTVPSPPNLYTSTLANVGKMRNRGLEILLNFVPVSNKSTRWNSTLTFSTNSNKLVSLSNDVYKLTQDWFPTGWIQEPVKVESHIVEVGKPIGEIWGFKVVDATSDGKWIYENANGERVNYDDFTHAQADKKVLGNGIPKWYLGWQNAIRYKNWDASISMRGAFGHQIINVARMFYENLSRQDWNRLQSAYTPIFGKAQLNSLCSEEFNSYYVENGDYWKIDNITIGYNFKQIGKYIKGLRLYATGQNLLTITGYKGTDPEVNISGLNPGYDDRDQYPSVRSFTLGVNINF